MKKTIKRLGTMATVGIMLVCAFWMGNITAKQTKEVHATTTQTITASIDNSCPQQRVMAGNYYDYMVIETVDGNEWLLNDTKDSKYIENGKAVFEDGELVQVIFDTKGTETVTDDVIIDVRSIDKRYK